MNENVVATLITLGIVIGGGVLLRGVVAYANMAFDEGYDIVVEGTVQVIRFDYSKLFKYDYTRVEMLTYSDAAYTITFLGHPPLELGATYRITYRRVSPLGHHVFMYADPINIEEIER